eukprot:2438563-Pleurochrysis_carterae.AAC.1
MKADARSPPPLSKATFAFAFKHLSFRARPHACAHRRRLHGAQRGALLDAGDGGGAQRGAQRRAAVQ